MGLRPQYDLPTAVTFLMAGLGIGSLLAILFCPRDPRPVLVPNSAIRHASPLNNWESQSSHRNPAVHVQHG